MKAVLSKDRTYPLTRELPLAIGERLDMIFPSRLMIGELSDMWLVAMHTGDDTVVPWASIARIFLGLPSSGMLANSGSRVDGGDGA